MIAISILFIILLLILGKKYDHRWAMPSQLISCFYLFNIISSYIGLKNSAEWEGTGVLWIAISMWILFFGTVCGIYLGKKIKLNYYNNTTSELSALAWFFLKLLIIIGIIRWILEVKAYGFSFANFLTLEGLGEINNTAAVARYSGKGKIDFIRQLMLIAVYAAPACGGFAYNFSKNNQDKIWAFTSILPCLLIVATTNTKATLIMGIMLWICNYITSYLFIYKKAPKIRLKGICIGIIIFIIFISLMWFSMMLRIGEVSHRTFDIVQRKFAVYAFGHIQAFDIWFERYRELEISLGKYTYFGIFNLIGLAKREQGVYTKLFGARSNVFTVFRGIIQDYGSIGGFIYIYIQGIFLGYGYNRVLRSNYIPEISSTILMCGIFFFLYGFIISPWSYMSCISLIIVFLFFLWLCKR